MEIVKEYSNEELTVVWKPAKCQHAGVCVNTLPNVYNPKEKPWIKPEKATTEELKNQIDKCPSGALTYYFKDKTDEKPDNVLIDNEAAKQYQFEIDKYIPRIEYIKSSDKIFLTHTEVPKELEGKGIASSLIRQVLMDIEQKDLTLVPLCPFVAAYIKRHPKWRKLVLKDINIQ